MLTIAHISDLHLSKITFSLSQFLSKRWIGNLNNLLFRRFVHSSKQIENLPKLFEKLKVDYLIITGDFTSTSQLSEFKAAQCFLKKVEERGIKVISIPGNHDQYTRKAYKNKSFYEFFENKQKSPLHLKRDGIEVFSLDKKWWFIGIDTAIPTSLISARGLFSEKLETTLKQVLLKIPKEDFIIFVNHYPFIKPKNPRRGLKRSSALKAILKQHKNIKLYLHGHTHKQTIMKGRPITLDSGSISHKRGSFNILELGSNQCLIKFYTWTNKWQLQKNFTFCL